jgi:hypothetical protein
MYNLECNDVFVANQEVLFRIFSLYNNKHPKYINMTDVLTLFGTKCNLNFSKKEILYCFGMSKMTVCGENYESESK